MSLSDLLGYFGTGSARFFITDSGIVDAGTGFVGELINVIAGNLDEWGS